MVVAAVARLGFMNGLALTILVGQRNLSSPALAAMVITASLSLADLPAVARLWRQRKAEVPLYLVRVLTQTAHADPTGDEHQRQARRPSSVPDPPTMANRAFTLPR